MSEPSPYCGRIDDHAPHEWIARSDRPDVFVLECPGAPITEGGQGPLDVRVVGL